jgi:iron complex outermembrane receptor protein
MTGVDRLTHANIDAGAALIVSEPGQPMGDILCYLPKVDANGAMVVDPVDGLYQIDFTEMKKVGNVTPDFVGGIGNYLEYKNFFVDFTIDFNFGSEVMSIARQYMKGAGMFEETLKYRDEANGGIAYYINGDGKKVADITTAPAGAKIFHDGLILDGVKPDGTKNDVVVDAASFYLNTYTWGANPAWGIPYSRYDDAVVKNNYIKFRELSIGYSLPVNVAKKIGCSNLRIALVGSNLFYIYRTMKEFDAETNLGSSWVNQAIVNGSTAATRSMGISIRASF